MIKQKSLVCKRLISKNLRGDRQAHCAAELIGSPTPKPTSSPIQCFGWEEMGDDPIATWKSKIRWCSDNNHFKDMNRIDGMPTEFAWKIIPGITTLSFLEKSQSLMRDLQCEPEHFKDRIIFMSRYNAIVWGEKKEVQKGVNTIQVQMRICSQIPSRSLAFLGTRIRKEMARDLL